MVEACKVIKKGNHYYAKHKYDISKLAFKEYYKEDDPSFKIDINKAYHNLQLSIWELKNCQNIENIQKLLSDIYQDCYIECSEEALYIYHPSSKVFDSETFKKTLEIIKEKSLYYWEVPAKDKKRNTPKKARKR